MQLGFVSAVLPDYTLEELLAFASSEQYDCVELMCWPSGRADRPSAGVTHLEVGDFSEADARRVGELTEKYGVGISGLGYYPNPLTPNPSEAEAYVEHIRKVILASRTLGVRQMNTFIGRDHTRSVDENWPAFLRTWRPLVSFAEDHGVRIGIENCPMYFSHNEWPSGKNLAHSPEIWRRMFDEIPSPFFGLNYDPSHLVWQQIDWIAPLREFATRLFHVHAKDARLDRGRLNRVGILATPLEFHSPKLPGLGDVDWGHFVSQLTDVGYEGAVCVEVQDRAFEGSARERKAALRQSRTYLRQFIPSRKGL